MYMDHVIHIYIYIERERYDGGPRGRAERRGSSGMLYYGLIYYTILYFTIRD